MVLFKLYFLVQEIVKFDVLKEIVKFFLQDIELKSDIQRHIYIYNAGHLIMSLIRFAINSHIHTGNKEMLMYGCV
jgi:hypothetical protein